MCRGPSVDAAMGGAQLLGSGGRLGQWDTPISSSLRRRAIQSEMLSFKVFLQFTEEYTSAAEVHLKILGLKILSSPWKIVERRTLGLVRLSALKLHA